MIPLESLIETASKCASILYVRQALNSAGSTKLLPPTNLNYE